MILLCCASELGLPEDLSAIEVILYYYYYYHTSLSDHYMIYTVYDRVFIIHDSNNKILMFRNYKKFSSELFIKDILACDCIYDTSWDSSLLKGKWDEFKNVFITVSDIHAPLYIGPMQVML